MENLDIIIERTQRSASSIQLPAQFSTIASSIPVLHYSLDDFVYDLKENSQTNHTGATTTFKTLLHERWEKAKSDNAFNYNLKCIYKEVKGKYNMSMQLNIERGELRRKPMRFKHIREPFNSLRWNFTKLHEKEILFYLRCEDEPISTDPLDRHVVAINASPLERDHSLIIPAVNKCLPQVLTSTAIRLATDVMLLVDEEDFNILFNSLLGQASVNHLHLHSLYWPHKTDLVNRKFVQLESLNAYIIEPPNWLCHAFAFQLQHKEDYEKFKTNLIRCCDLLSGQGQAHNMFITRAQPIRTEGPDWEEDTENVKPRYVTAYVFPRTNMIGAKPPTNFNPAANELAGCLTSYTQRFYETSTEQACVRIIEEEALISDEVFKNFCYDLSDVLSGRVIGTSRPHQKKELEKLTSDEIDELRDAFNNFGSHSPDSTRRERTNSAGNLRTTIKFTFTGAE